MRIARQVVGAIVFIVALAIQARTIKKFTRQDAACALAPTSDSQGVCILAYAVTPVSVASALFCLAAMVRFGSCLISLMTDSDRPASRFKSIFCAMHCICAHVARRLLRHAGCCQGPASSHSIRQPQR